MPVSGPVLAVRFAQPADARAAQINATTPGPGVGGIVTLTERERPTTCECVRDIGSDRRIDGRQLTDLVALEHRQWDAIAVDEAISRGRTDAFTRGDDPD